jgi:dihydropteroate synthase
MTEIIRYFSEKISFLNQKGIYNIIIDPGFGFGKTTRQCFEIIENFEMLKILEKPILVGASRKSMIYKTLNSIPENSLNGTTTIHSFLLQKGGSVFRVHDVKEMNEIRLLNDCSRLF